MHVCVITLNCNRTLFIYMLPGSMVNRRRKNDVLNSRRTDKDSSVNNGITSTAQTATTKILVFISSCVIILVITVICFVMETHDSLDGQIFNPALNNGFAEALHDGQSELFIIDRRSNLSLAEFAEKYDGKRPVLITDVLQNWRAINWSKKFFVKHYGNQKVFMKAVQGTIQQAESFAVEVNVFSQHVHEGQPNLWTYVEDELFIHTHPKLQKDLQEPVYLKEDLFQLLPKEVQPWNAMLLWGTAYSRSSLHIDPYNWTGTNAVFYGKKMWKADGSDAAPCPLVQNAIETKLYPPGQDEYLYVLKNRRCNFPLDCIKYNSPVDAFTPNHQKYPLFQKANAISFTQKAGELLIIPSGWFHQAFNPEESIAVSSQVMNSQNYKICLEEIFKAGEIDREKVPPYFKELSPADQVMTVTRLIPSHILKKGKKVTENLLKQLQ